MPTSRVNLRGGAPSKWHAMVHIERSARRSRMAVLLSVIVGLWLAVAPSAASGRLIEESRFVTIGGIEQWISIRGADTRNPVLLILHGGPGDTQSPFTKTCEPLEQDFVVVQWDQRGAGKTRAHARQAGNISLELLVSDGIDLAQYLRDYLHSKSVVLVGHSWGSFLGVQIVKRRPDLFRAFVGTGQVVSTAEMIDYQYRYALERARQTNNDAAVTELEALGRPASGDLNQYLKLRRWLNLFLAPSDAQWMAAQDGMLQRALGPDDLKAYWEGFQTMTGLTSTVFSMDVQPVGDRF